MTLTDTLIARREAILNRVLGVRPDEVLNPVTSGQVPGHGVDVAAGLKRAVNAFKAAAILAYQPYDWALNISGG